MLKTKTSLRTTRRRQKNATANEENCDNDDAFEDVVSPKPPRFQLSSVSSPVSRGTSRLRLASPITPKVKAKNKSTDTENKSVDENFDHDILSQHPTPSKWNSLLPDYFGSQMDCDVLWDCSSPDAVRHLRRRKKNDNSNVKEIVKLFKAAEPSERSSSPPLLSMLRSSLQRQQQQKEHPSARVNSKKSRKSRRRKQEQDSEEQAFLDKVLKAFEQGAAGSSSSGKPEPSCASQPGTAEGDSAKPAAEEDIADHDSSWGDDDLFENSFIIAATQNPELFLNASSTSTPKAHSKRLTAPSQQPASDNDSQDSGVIPPTWVGGGRLPGAGRNPFSVNGDAAAFRSANNPLSPVQSSKDVGGKLQGSGRNPVAVNGSAAVLRGTDGPLGANQSPRSRFRLQRQPKDWTRRVLSPTAPQPVQAEEQGGSTLASNPAQVKNTNTHSSIKAGPAANSHSAQAAVRPGPVGNSGSVFAPLPAHTQIKNTDAAQGCVRAAPSGNSGSLLTRRPFQTQNTNTVFAQSAVKVASPVNSSSSAHLNGRMVPKGQGSAAANAQTVNFTKTRSSVTSAQQSWNRVSHQGTSSKWGTSPSLKKTVSDPFPLSANNSLNDGFDDSLPEDVLLQLTEQDEEFESQAIQQYPTQGPKKPVCTLTKAPAQGAFHAQSERDMNSKTHAANSNHSELFDDMDCELLASIDFTSFTESPLKNKQNSKQAGAASSKPGNSAMKIGTVPTATASRNQSYGASKNRQPQQSNSFHQKPVGDSLGGSVTRQQKSGLTFKSTISSGVTKAPSNGCGTRTGQVAGNTNSAHARTSVALSNPTAPSTQLNGGGSGVRWGNDQKTVSTKTARPTYPSSSGVSCGKPLATIAHSNTAQLVGKAPTAEKKFAFKPVASLNSGRTSQVNAASSMKPPVATTPSVATASAGAVSQDAMDDDDDLLCDDALYESQIIALLDEVESQVSQQTQKPRAPSPPKISNSQEPYQCSQEEIEKKRQAAMQRRLRSASRATSKPP